MRAAPSQEQLPEPRSSLAGVERYPDGGRERDAFVALDRNERLSPLPAAVVDEVREAVTSALLTTYPATDLLYEELAEAWSVPRERLLLTAGSDAAVKALYQVYAEPGDRVVMMDPSYAMYSVYAEMFGADAVRIPFGEDLTIDTGALLAAIEPGVKMVLLANPNQPTGTVLDPAVLDEAVERAAAVRALVLVDEAYYPFSGTTVLDQAGERPNLMVSRTFSKAWGLAGMRLGVLAAAPEVVRALTKVRSAYDVNAMAAAAARVLLRHPEVAEQAVADVEAGREAVRRCAEGLGLELLPCPTNFQLIRVEQRADPAGLVAALRERGYLVKGPFGSPGLTGCIRITLGPPELMRGFCEALEQTLA